MTSTRLDPSEISCSHALVVAADEPRRLSLDFLGTRRFRDIFPFKVGFGAIGTGLTSDVLHGATRLMSSAGSVLQGVAVVKQMVGICGFDAGVARGGGHRG